MLAAAAGLTLAAGGFAAAAWARTAATPVTVVRVIAKDFSFALSRKTVPVGKVRFVVVNRGATGHDFALVGRRKTPVLRPSAIASFEVMFAKAGTVAYRCTVPGHAALGMRGIAHRRPRGGDDGDREVTTAPSVRSRQQAQRPG